MSFTRDAVSFREGRPEIVYGLSSSAQSTFMAPRSSILSVLDDAITTGCLTISKPSGTYRYGRYNTGCNDVHLAVLNDQFWLRLLISGDLGFSEAYMIGDIERPDLKGIMNVVMAQKLGWYAESFIIQCRKTPFSNVRLYNSFLGQTISQARFNAIASYDQSNELFKSFLSQEMMYSCALWSDVEGGVRGDLKQGPILEDLGSARLCKIYHVLKKARVQPGHRILEFGSGWGGLAIEAARTFGAELDTLTLSGEQKSLAEERVKAAGLDG
ncbi:S-adenosyl-L-methionine-dependent methyltransferase [Mycena floridula]|nr:S-adenosyl-L-methionine-dependent methyltransferase [Mycena floridula]